MDFFVAASMEPNSVNTFVAVTFKGAMTDNVVKLAESSSIIAPNEIDDEKAVAVAVPAAAAFAKLRVDKVFIPIVEDLVVDMRLEAVDHTPSKIVSEVPTWVDVGVPLLTSATYRLAPVDLVPDR